MPDGLRGPIEGRARLGKPYLRLACLGVLAASILGLGYFGPHPASGPTTAPPSPRGSGDVKPAASAPLAPASPRAAGGVDALGLAPVEPIPGQIAESWLPPQITSRSPAVVGLRLFYVVGSDRIESSVVGSSDGSQMLTSVPRCQAINQLAAAGHELAYVVTSPGGPAAAVGGCGGVDPGSWSVWILDLTGGNPRRVAQGTLVANSIEQAEFPIHIALTASAYAFDRPTAAAGAGQGTTVEVHAIDGRLLWSSRSPAPVDTLMLGGDKLAVLTRTSTTSGPPRTLWISDAGHPLLAEVARPASSASLAPDGSYLAWDVWRGVGSIESSVGPAVDIEMLDSGRVQALTTQSRQAMPDPLQPSISITRAGPAISWFATAPDGSVYPAFRFVGGGDGAVLTGFGEPTWIGAEGGTLIWLAQRSDGWSTLAFAVDMVSVGAQ